jgi:hypothetical protein
MKAYPPWRWISLLSRIERAKRVVPYLCQPER